MSSLHDSAESGDYLDTLRPGAAEPVAKAGIWCPAWEGDQLRLEVVGLEQLTDFTYLERWA